MCIDTTINITDNYRLKLIEASKVLKISKSEIVKNLINTYQKQSKNKSIKLKRVSYQKKDDNESWAPIHIWMDNVFYEKCQDLKKIHKQTLSKIVTIAIALYLEDILNGQLEELSNDYKIYYSIINNEPLFTIVWGNISADITKCINKIHGIYVE